MFPLHLSVILPFILFIFFLVKWLLYYTSTSSPTKKNLPPSPSKLPILGNLHQIVSSSHPHRSLHSLSKKHGPDLMLLHFGTKPVLVVSSADAAREIMKTHDLSFSSRPKLSIPHKLMYNGKDIAFSPYGEYWRKARSVCVVHLLSNKMVHSFRSVREEEISNMIEKIGKNSRSLINLSDEFMKLTNDVICRVALGKKYGEEEEAGRKAKAALTEFVELLGKFFCVGDYLPWLSWWNRINGLDAKVKRVNKEIDELIEMAIEEHCGKDSDNESQDFVDILLDLQMKNVSSAMAVERDTIKAIILDMFAAGTDTTHSVMEWAMTELLRHPKIMKKLQDEVRQVAPGKEQVTEDDIDKMHYLKAVIKETLRLHFPVPLLVPRESTQDVKVMGYDISAGTQVIVNGWSIARDPVFWENAEEFRPDRFYDSDSGSDGDGRKNIDYRGLNFQFIPFGGGRRICPGMNFAIAVNELVLAKLMHKFDFALPNNEEKCIPESIGITIHRKFPPIVTATQPVVI